MKSKKAYGDLMSLQDNQIQFEQLKPRLHRTEFDHLKSRLDMAQLELTVTALHETLPEAKANEAEATLRRMFARAKRWEA
jgi:hypothetical protein